MNLTQVYTGACRYDFGVQAGQHRLLVGLPCQVGEVGSMEYALLDSGATWCVLPPDLAEDLGCEPVPGDPPVRLDSRLGLFAGYLTRIRLWLPALHGEPLPVEATWFISPDWPGPMVIGWQGCLERFRFGIDPSEDVFYFAAL